MAIYKAMREFYAKETMKEPQKQLIDLSLPKEKPLTFGDVAIGDFFIDHIGRLSQKYSDNQYNILTDYTGRKSSVRMSNISLDRPIQRLVDLEFKL